MGCLANVFIILKEIHDAESLIQITLSYDAQHLSKATRDTAAIYLACGVDTSKVSNFLFPFEVHAINCPLLCVLLCLFIYFFG